MKVMRLPKKKNYMGRWDVMIGKSTKCLNRLIEIAARKERNYILDQTNVYASAQQRKMQPFEGFQRKAVVVIPTDDEFKRRLEKKKEERKEVSEKAVLEMKANFSLPEVGQLFDGVEFAEEENMSAEEAAKLIDKYKEEARKLLRPPEKHFRDSRFRNLSRYDFSRGYRFRLRGGYRCGFDFSDRRSGGGWRGGYSSCGGFSYDSWRFDNKRSYENGRGGSYRSGDGYQAQRSYGDGSFDDGYNTSWVGQWGATCGYGNRNSCQW